MATTATKEMIRSKSFKPEVLFWTMIGFKTKYLNKSLKKNNTSVLIMPATLFSN